MSEIGVGLVGYKFMGKAHSNAYRQVAHFFDVDPVPRMVSLCGRDEAGVRQAAAKFGWEGYQTDYRALVARDDINLVDVATTGTSHCEIVLAALEHGKHVLCEKPLANSLEEAGEMLSAAEAAAKRGVVAMVNFNYRRVPAVQLARQILDEGKLGTIRHFRATYLQDWILDPEFPLVWRLQKNLAGSGALGDIGAHILDLAHFLVGPLTDVVAMMETFITERPLENVTADETGLRATGGPSRGKVTVDDSAAFLARFSNGATGVFEATRLAPGRRNKNSFEINGSLGSLRFDLERMNELEVYFVDDDAGLQGFRTLNVTDVVHPYMESWWPAGHIIGYEHTFIHVVKDLLDGIKACQSPSPTFHDGYLVQAVLDAVERSAESRAWEKPNAPPYV